MHLNNFKTQKEVITMKTAKELNLKVGKVRLMTASELNTYEELVPEVNGGVCWWLADVNDDDCAAYAEGNYTDEDMFSYKDEANTYFRPVLEIEDTEKVGIRAGDEFVYCGYVFTVLSNTLAIANNFIGSGKYYDDEIVAFIYSDDEITCTIDAFFGNVFCNG